MCQKMPDTLKATLKKRYILAKRIGQGGFGVIYSSYDTVLEIPVAIKFLTNEDSGEQAVKKFIKEARALAQVRSPHVVRVFDFGIAEDGRPYLVMEWIDGEDIRFEIVNHTVTEAKAVLWMKQVCKGMIELEKNKLVHRDISPANILIDKNANAVLTDFGLAFGGRDYQKKLPRRPCLGNVDYCSPEQDYDANRADQRADIYSFGATFYHALIGRPAFKGPDDDATRKLHDEAPLKWPKTNKLSGTVRSLIERCMAKKPTDRFQTFGEVLDYLNKNTPESLPWQVRASVEIEPVLERFSQRLHRYLGHSAAACTGDRFTLANGNKIVIKQGDLSLEKADAIVSAASEKVGMSGGLSLALCDRGGKSIRAEAGKFAPVKAGRVVVTSAGNLHARFVFHSVTIDFSEKNSQWPNIDTINNILDSCFYHADTLNVESIAFPLLGTGLGGFSRELCLDTMFRNIVYKLSLDATPVRRAVIVLHNGPSLF